jgi:hypothetical protein
LTSTPWLWRFDSTTRGAGTLDDISAVPMPEQGTRNRLRRAWSLIKEKEDARSLAAFGMIIVVAAAPIITLTASILTALTAALQLLFGLSPSTWLWIAVFTTTLFSISITLVTYFSQRNLYRMIEAARWRDDFRLLHHTSLCFVYSESKITYRYLFVVRPRKSKRFFEFTFTWSGSGNIEINIRNSQHSLNGVERIPVGNQRLLTVDLGREIGKDNVETIEFDLVTDATEPAMPYLALPISSRSHPRFNTHLMVAFGPGVNVSRVFKDVSLLGAGAMSGRKTTPENIPDNRLIHWRVPVRFGLRYALRWVYDRGTNMDGE